MHFFLDPTSFFKKFSNQFINIAPGDLSMEPGLGPGVPLVYDKNGKHTVSKVAKIMPFSNANFAVFMGNPPTTHSTNHVY